jgi:hypothetical protein
VSLNYLPDEELIEDICENEKDFSHLVAFFAAGEFIAIGPGTRESRIQGSPESRRITWRARAQDWVPAPSPLQPRSRALPTGRT